MAWTGLNYNAPNDTLSSIDDNGGANDSKQFNTFKYMKKALITARKEQFFTPLATVENMPKHFGKTIKVYEYIPLLDDRNINDQGIFADGVTTGNGNLYGSSKDIGTIEGKLPLLREEGGRVNRVGFTRIAREGSLLKFGFFTEFTQESIDFDSDEQLMDHQARELMNGAVQISEAVLQKELLAGAGVEYFAGGAATPAAMTAEGSTPSVVEYEDFTRLDQILTDNRTPKHTTIITGSRYQDTRVIPAARIAYVGSEVVPLLKTLQDSFNAKVFIGVQHYADAGTVLNGEIGSIDSFRIIQVPEMLHWAGGLDSASALTGGALVVTDDEGFRTTTVGAAQYFNIYPILVIGDDSFTTIGFQTDGKSVKFNVLTKMPGRETASHDNPYGETGFSSIKWYHGTLIKRPERIALLRTLAPI